MYIIHLPTSIFLVSSKISPTPSPRQASPSVQPVAPQAEWHVNATQRWSSAPAGQVTVFRALGQTAD